MNKVALLIGVSQYEPGFSPLPSALQDVAAMRQVLENPEIGGFSEVQELLNPEPQMMQEQIEIFFQNRAREDLVLLFFSGHGVKDERGRLYFATRITRKTEKGELIKSTTVPASFIHDIMSNSRIKRQIVILDCCFSGAFATDMPFKGSTTENISANIQEQLGAEGRAVLTSSSATQYSFEQPEAALSVYTRYLVEGLTTGAADQGGDGVISVDELHEYARSKVQEAAPAMKPEIYAVREGYKIQLAKAPIGDVSLIYRKEVEELVRSSHGEISYLDRPILDARRVELNLSPEEASTIETEVLQPYEDYRQKLRTYENTWRQVIQREVVISSTTRSKLKRLQQALKLRDEDITPIEDNLPPQREAEVPPRSSPAASVPHSPEPTSKPRSSSTPHSSPEPFKPQASSSQQSNRSQSPQRPVTLVETPGMNRQQFLKWAGFGGAGFVLAMAVRAILDNPSSTHSDGTTPGSSPSTPTPATPGGNPIKVGILNSLSGTMAISEKSVVDSTLLAIDQINKAGGVIGKQIEPITEDGASDWPTFAEKARKLIEQDEVVVIFGGWTSASRKAMLPVLEEKNHMLFFPVQYEGQECSKNIFYTGGVPNQQIEPSVDWLLENKGKEFYLVGSDFVFPRTANTIIKAQLQAKGGMTIGEDYLPLGNTEVAPIIAKIRAALPSGGVIYNTLNGDSNVAFFKQLLGAGLTPDQYPVMSTSIAEEEVQAIGSEFLKGQYAVWNYFMTIDNPVNKAYVDAFRAQYGESRVMTDPMEAAYISVHLWKQAVEKVGSEGTPQNLEQVRAAMIGQTFDAPEGPIKMYPNHHISKFVRIGQVREDGLFQIVYASETAVLPSPWNQFVAETKGFVCDWTKTNVENPGKFKL